MAIGGLTGRGRQKRASLLSGGIRVVQAVNLFWLQMAASRKGRYLTGFAALVQLLREPSGKGVTRTLRRK